MATSQEYIDFVCSMISNEYTVRYKKMFGEYMVYVNDKPVLLVCNNSVFVKQLNEVKDFLQSAEEGIPYKGSKPHYIMDMENKELVDSVIRILKEVTPVPKKKVKKQ